jgi:hypothetical protein
MVDLMQIMRNGRGYLMLVLLILFVGYPAFVQAQAVPGQPPHNPLIGQAVRTRRAATDALMLAAVNLRNNQLDIDVQDQDLHDIVNEIATQGDIKISKLEGIPNKQLSLRFSNLSVVTGLKRLFRAAEIESYVLVTDAQGDAVRVQRIMFFPPSDGRSPIQTHGEVSRQSPAAPALPLPPTPEDREGSDSESGESGSVFEDLKTNTAARRLLSQLVHPNEQVRERALERLIRLVDSDDKQAELLEFLEPLMEDLASEDDTVREAARQEVRKLLRR